MQYLRGSITFLEDRIACPDFTGGKGNSFVAGLAFEHWEKYNRFCIRAGVSFEYMNLRTATIDYVPLSPYLTGEYETSLLMQHSQINVHAGIKYRILNTHWGVGADLLLCAVAGDSFSVTETILGPPEVPPFGTLPPSFSRTLITGHSDVNRLRLQPLISVGYDIPLFRGTYIEPTLYFTLPTFTLLSGDNIRNYNVFLGVRVLTAL